MDEQQLHSEFMSILSESHPGLTFEEYRDSCVFLLFYHYLCIKYEAQLKEEHQLSTMVHMAVRGKLQIDSFLKFIDSASRPLHELCPQFHLSDFSFYKRLHGTYAQEKQKSLARFIRKLIKKINAWENKEVLCSHYGEFFSHLMGEFAKQKKETHISEPLIRLYEILLNDSRKKENSHLFQPEFNLGILLNKLVKDNESAYIYGYENTPEFLEIFHVILYMNHREPQKINLYNSSEWKLHGEHLQTMDGVIVYMPDGVEPGVLVTDWMDYDVGREIVRLKSRGEFPFLLSALSCLNDDGEMAVVMPSGLLYREGKEMLVRRYLVEEKNLLDTVVILPDHLFDAGGQNQVLLYFKKNRQRSDVMFYDCSENPFGEEEIQHFKETWNKRGSIPGYCACVAPEVIRENDFNLNIPRYISKNIKKAEVDIETRRERIREINQELKEIEEKMTMYRRDLNIIL